MNMKYLCMRSNAYLPFVCCKERDDESAEEQRAPGIARCLEGNCANGRGVKVEATGERYEGDWKGGLREGAASPPGPTGRPTWASGKTTIPTAKGIYVKAGGEKYEGQWEKGKRQGRGTATWPDGSTYTGDFRDDRSDGRGVFTDTSGVKYEGQFRDGRAHGSGVLISPDGKKTSGRWHDGKPVL